MQITKPPNRFKSEQDEPITNYEPDNARWEEVSLMRRGDELIVRAKDASTEEIIEQTFSVGQRTFKALRPPTGKRRRDVDDDLLDLLLLEGYAVADGGVQQY